MGGFDGLKIGQINSGYWGNHTASIDWCESNYTHSPYIAEFVNTITNLPVCLLGIYGTLATLAGGVQKRYALGYLGLTLIGIGSFGFHATLKWEWQMMDELPMIYIISYSALLVFDTLPGFKHRFGIFGPIAYLTWCTFVTLSYIYMPNPIIHQIAFGIILLSTTGRNLYLLSELPADHPNRKLISRTQLNGVATFVLGFILWNVDNFFCAQLRKGRELVGPLSFILEGHGYWHLMTGYGAFLMSTSSICLQLGVKVSPDAYSFDRDSWFPVVYAVNTLEMPGKGRSDALREVGEEKAPLGGGGQVVRGA